MVEVELHRSSITHSTDSRIVGTNPDEILPADRSRRACCRAEASIPARNKKTQLLQLDRDDQDGVGILTR